MKKNFVQTSFKLTPHVDPYTSQYDFDQMNDGWFVTAMPDLNQKNPHVYRYRYRTASGGLNTPISTVSVWTLIRMPTMTP